MIKDHSPEVIAAIDTGSDILLRLVQRLSPTDPMLALVLVEELWIKVARLTVRPEFRGEVLVQTATNFSKGLIEAAERQ